MQVVKSYKNAAILVLILGIAFFLRTPFFSVPMDRDEGTYATVTQTILNGGMPYKDVFTIRAPGIYYIYAIFFKMFGERVEAIRIGSAIFALLTTVLIFKLTDRQYGYGTGIIAALIYAIFSSGPLIQGSFANCEAFMVLPAVASTYMFYLGHKEQDNRFFFGAGIFSGVAYLIKESTLPNLLFFYIFLIIICRRDLLKQLPVKFFILSIGFMLPIAAFLLYLGVNGALSDYISATYSWNKGYGNYKFGLFVSRFLSRGVYSLGREYAFLWLASALAVLIMVIKDRSLHNAYVVLWIIFSFLGVCLGSMFWPHYFIQMIPSLSVGAAYAVGELYKGMRNQRGLIKTGYLTVAVLLLFSILSAVKTDYKFYLVHTPDEISKNIYDSDIFVNSKKVAAYIKDRTGPADFIYQSRWEPEIYFLSQRKSPTRYIDHLFLLASSNPEGAIDELGYAILSKEPKYIAWLPSRPGEVQEQVVRPIIDLKYDLETEIGGIKLYHLKKWEG